MAFAFVQAAKNARGSTPFSIGPITTTAGNLLVFVICNDHSHPATAPTGVNTYVQAGTTGVDSANGQEASIWYAANIAGGSETVTATPTTLTAITAVLMEFSGIATAAPLDTTATPKGGGAMGSTPTSNSLSAAAANELLLLAVNDTSDINATFTAGTGQTLNANANEAGISGTGATAVSYGSSASGSQTAFMNNTQTADDAVILLAAFKIAGAAAANSGFLTVMG